MSSRPFSIRRARAADAPRLAVLYTELGYAASAEEIDRRLPRILADDEDRLFVAVDRSDVPIGCLHIRLLAILERDLSAQILSLVVSSAHHRRGIGRALAAAAETWAAAQGCVMVYVRTNIRRPAAPAFYAGIGYVNNKTQYAFRKPLNVPPDPPSPP